MQLGRTAWAQMSPSSTPSCAPGAGPTWWQVKKTLGQLDESRQDIVLRKSLQSIWLMSSGWTFTSSRAPWWCQWGAMVQQAKTQSASDLYITWREPSNNK